MATLAMFDGIIIRMNPERNTRHHKPHIHARYQGAEASFDIASRKMIAGSKNFPKDQCYMVQAWIVRHEKELYANWELLKTEGTFFKIEPLR